MAGQSVGDLQAALLAAQAEYERSQALSYVAVSIQELEERIAREEVHAIEDELDRRTRWLDEVKGRVVLKDHLLSRDLDFVRSEIKRAEMLLKYRATAKGDDRDYARQCIQETLCQLRKEIQQAVPASYEKERLEIRQESANYDYAIVTGHVEDPKALERIMARVLSENTVDETWLIEQREAIRALEQHRDLSPMKEPVRAPVMEFSR